MNDNFTIINDAHEFLVINEEEYRIGDLVIIDTSIYENGIAGNEYKIIPHKDTFMIMKKYVVGKIMFLDHADPRMPIRVRFDDIENLGAIISGDLPDNICDLDFLRDIKPSRWIRIDAIVGLYNE